MAQGPASRSREQGPQGKCLQVLARGRVFWDCDLVANRRGPLVTSWRAVGRPGGLCRSLELVRYKHYLEGGQEGRAGPACWLGTQRPKGGCWRRVAGFQTPDSRAQPQSRLAPSPDPRLIPPSSDLGSEPRVRGLPSAASKGHRPASGFILVCASSPSSVRWGDGAPSSSCRLRPRWAACVGPPESSASTFHPRGACAWTPRVHPARSLSPQEESSLCRPPNSTPRGSVPLWTAAPPQALPHPSPVSLGRRVPSAPTVCAPALGR